MSRVEAVGLLQAGGDQVFDFGPVELGALDPVGAVVAPVHLAAARVEGEAERLLEAFDDEVLDL